MQNSRPDDTAKARATLQHINHELDSHPHDRRLWLQKALCFERAMAGTIPGDQSLDRTIFFLRHSLPKDGPNSWTVLYNHAAVLINLSRYQEALSFLEQGLPLRPRHARFWDALLTAARRTGRFRLALQYEAEARRKGIRLPRPITGIGEYVDLDDELLSNLYRDPQHVAEAFRDGRLPMMIDTVDPDMAALMFEVSVLKNLGLTGTAERLLIEAEMHYGAMDFIRSELVWLKLRAGTAHDGDPITGVSPAWPLLDAALAAPQTKVNGATAVRQAFADKRSSYEFAVELSKFDDEVRWYLQNLTEEFSIYAENFAITPIPPQIAWAWSLATTGFMAALAVEHNALIAYTATTVAEFYQKIGSYRLPIALYGVAAAAAEAAAMPDYVITAHSRCANLLLDSRRDHGAALAHLLAAEPYAEGAQNPLNRYNLYMFLARLCTDLELHEESATWAGKALAAPGISAERKKFAELFVAGNTMMFTKKVVELGLPSVQLADLPTQAHTVELPGRRLTMVTTSRHELYDSLLQFYDHLLTVRRSLLNRRLGQTYLQRMHRVAEEVVQTALAIDLPDDALLHLEAQKNLILNSRVSYLLKERPSGVPDPVWEEFQAGLRRLQLVVEAADPAAPAKENSQTAAADGVDQLRTTFWKIRLVSDTGTSRLGYVLGTSSVPQMVACVAPESTLILEFFFSKGRGTCFVVRPSEPRKPRAITLPDAGEAQVDRLLAWFQRIAQDWNDAPDYGPPWIARTLEEFGGAAAEMDRCLYDPIAAALDRDGLTRLCLVPYRTLHALPLNLLGWSRTGKSLDGRFQLSFSPSLSFLASTHPRRGQPYREGLVVCDPTPDCPADLCRFNADHDCFSLPWARPEGEYIRGRMAAVGIGSRVLSGTDATLGEVAQAGATADIIHFACHNVFDATHPEDSGLALNPRPIGSEDAGPFISHRSHHLSDDGGEAVAEVLSLRRLWNGGDFRRCRFLNLAGCSTGLVDWTDRSDEFNGLANGFLCAGVENVLVATWPINDAVSLAFSKLFYDHLIGAIAPPVKALQCAVGALRTMSAAELAEQLKCVLPETADVARLVSAVSLVPDQYRGIGLVDHPLMWGGYRLVGDITDDATCFSDPAPTA